MEQGRKSWDPSVQICKEGLSSRNPASGKELEEPMLFPPVGSETFEGLGVELAHYCCQEGSVSPLLVFIPVRQARHSEFKM